MTKKTDAVLAVLCLFFTLTLAVRLFVFPKDHDGRRENTVFLNPKHLSDLDEIIVQSGGQTISISKPDDLYLVSSDTDEIFADRDMVFRLMQVFSMERTIFPVDAGDGEKYGIFGENSATVIFKANNGEVLSVTFGNLDSLLKQIYFTTPGRQGVYETDDDFSEFFFQRITFWADCDLIPAHRKFKVGDVQSLTVTHGGKTENLENREEFITKILSSRGGNVVSRNNLSPENRVANIDFTLTSGIEFSLEFISVNDGYAVVFVEKDAGFSSKSALEISEYTFQRIFT